MSIGTSGSYDIIQKTSTSISSQTSGGSSTYSYLSSSFTIQNMTGEYYQVQINITPETYSNLLVNSVIVKTPSLTCSTTSTITFSLASYNGGQIPSWVSCNSVSGVLTMNTPNVSSSTNYMFYINADVPGTLSPIQKLITVGITQCLVSHWDTWSSTDTTVWITWSYFYAVSSGSCTQNPSSEVSSINIATKSTIGAQALITTTLSAFTNSSLASLWSMINQLQLFLLLLLTGVYFPKDVIDVIIGSKFALFTLNLIPFSSFSFSTNIINKIYLSQSFSMLERIGFDSGSSFVNNYGMIFSFVLCLIFHLFVFIIIKLLAKKNIWKGWTKTHKTFSWIFIKIYNFLTFGYYIRVILESFQYLLISSISEIDGTQLASTSDIISFIVAVVIILIWFLFLIFSWILAHRTKQIIGEERDKFGQFFEGIKNNKISKYYVSFLLARRFIFVTALITLGLKSSTITLSIWSGVQVLYLGSLIFLRPFYELKDNIIEIINEVFFWVFLGSLFRLSSKENWTDTFTSVYVYLIVANNGLIFFIVLGNSILI